MNTGHTGGGGTIHANAASAVPARLAALGALAGLSQDAVRLQVASAVEAVVHVERTATGRRVASIGIMEAGESGLGVTVALEVLNDRVGFGPAWPQLAARLGLDSGTADGTTTGSGAAGAGARLPGPGSGPPESWAPR
jgi:pilus assembly protein CpaF